MDAEAVIRALLVADSAVTALAPATRIYPSEIPESATLPALATNTVSTVDLPTDGAAGEANRLVRSRVEVTVVAADLVQHQQLMRAVTNACRYQRGSVAGVSVVLVERDSVGVRRRDPDTGVYTQPVDFFVTHREP